jgi:hypothetical protein
VEDNLKTGYKVYTFNARWYKDTGKAILIGSDVLLQKSEVKIIGG